MLFTFLEELIDLIFINKLTQFISFADFLFGIILYMFMVMDLYSMAMNNASSLCSGDYDQTNERILFPLTNEPVWILGKKYSTLHEMEELLKDYKSRIWITYRKGFVPIGGTGPTSDYGWGCMLRCGQMVLAQALVNKYLTRDWRWEPNSSVASELQYREILKLFQEKKNSVYSIHQIAQMGANEGKEVGQWFGPNTIAQVLKKLSQFDKRNNIVIHVSLDNLVIIDEIKSLCKVTECDGKKSPAKVTWKPLVLFIPLRLGLSEINSIYFNSLKTTFTFPQSLGIIGGRPNHALYFVGAFENKLVYLDPHDTQQTIDLDQVNSDDSSYHCEIPSHMNISNLDPSISLCFYCHTERDFEKWCNLTKQLLIINEKQPLFELTKERPFPLLQQQTIDEPEATTSNGQESFTLLEDFKNNSDEEYELL